MNDEEKECCGQLMIKCYEGIGGFPGHEHIHPGRFLYWRCEVCDKKIYDEDNRNNPEHKKN